MKKTASLFAMLIVGCGVTSIPDYPEIDPEDPASIELWESSPYNVNNAKIAVLELDYLHGKMGSETPKSPRKTAIEVCNAKENGISQPQKKAIDFLIQSEPKIHVKVRKAMYEFYIESYSDFASGARLYGGDRMEEVLPKIVDGNEIDGLAEFGTITIHPALGENVAIGFDFYVPWTVDSISLRLESGEVTAIGTDMESQPPPPQKGG